MLISALIIVSVFCTAVLSGVLGMAGGMILMAILVSTVSVSAAMMIHGAVQAMSNGSRAVFLRRHVQWHILPPYVTGAALALAAFTALTLVPDAGLVLLLVGVMPFLARVTPRLRVLDMNHWPTALGCGVLVTAAQLLAGASGPLLDMFYLNSTLTRHQVVASKAITQTLGHVLKLVYYGMIIGSADALPAWLYAAAMLTAVAGTRVGTRFLDRLADDTFRRVSGWVILAIAGVCVVEGVRRLMG
ncbi:MAG: TSUP family transporter [Gammaproteobacteria bacterium]|nr:TSUP family transporter [Gammaproteobacteria bacterium]